jgi:hypothetical protein
MTEILVEELESSEFGVQVVEGSLTTSHRVTVPDRFVEELGLPDVDLHHLVRESFRFLLEREPATSILREFSLEEIGEYFPEYFDEIRLRLS